MSQRKVSISELRRPEMDGKCIFCGSEFSGLSGHTYEWACGTSCDDEGAERGTLCFSRQIGNILAIVLKWRDTKRANDKRNRTDATVRAEACAEMELLSLLEGVEG